MSYAQFELEYSNGENSTMSARCIYERANQALRSATQKEERVLLLEAWRDFETKHGDAITLNKLLEKMPRRVKKRQRILAQDGVSSANLFKFFIRRNADEKVRF